MHDCRLGGGGGGHVPEAGLRKFSLALATLGSGRVLRLKLNKTQADILTQILMFLDLLFKIILSTITNMFVILCSDLKLMGGFTYYIFIDFKT